MRRTRIILGAALLGIVTLPVLAHLSARPTRTAHAQSATYAINWFTIDGGGATSSSGSGYSLSGTIGQPDAGTLSGLPYTLAGGFWAGSEPRYTIAVPIVRR
jgi:hypothetical protein